MSRRGWLLFAAMGVIWGIPYLLIKVADGGVSVPVLVCTRVALGSLLLLPAALRGGHLRALKGNVRWLAAFTALEIVGPFALLSNAEKHLPSSTSGLLVAAVPIFSALLAWLTRAGDRLTLIRWIGLAIGLGGVALLAGPGAGRGSALPVLEVLGTALGYSIGPLIANRKLAHLPPVAVNTVCLGAAAVVYAPFAALTFPSRVPSVQVLLALAALGVVCTAAAFLVFFRLIAEVGPARATVITYVNPAVAVALGVIVLGEHLTAAIGVSFLLILGGSVLATRPSEPKGRGADWTEERGTSDEGRRRLESGPEASEGQTDRPVRTNLDFDHAERNVVRAVVSETAASPADAAPGLRMKSARGRWVVAATVLGSGMAALDSTVVGIALPAIGRNFHVGVSAVQWVVDGYTLTLAGLLLLGGTLGDSYGRRKMFVIGTIWFAVASLLCGIAPDVGTLIAARALQGVGGALLTPGSLAILQASFAENDRMAAIGAWSGLGGVATAIGPFLGGWLIGAVSWRLVFFINLPIAVLVVAISTRHVPETKAPGPVPKLDVRGAAAISGALAGITYGLISASSYGWGTLPVLLPLGLGAVLLGLFVLIEDKEPQPMLPLGIFRSRQFTAANAVTFVVYAALGGLLFLVPVVLQVAHGYSPVEAGTALLPITFIMLALSSRSGALASRIGPRLQMTVGPLVIAASFLLFTSLATSGNYLTAVLPAVVVFGLGVAIMVAPLTATALAAAPADHAGVASAVNNDVARAAGLIAVAVLPALAGITGNSYLHPAALAHGFKNAALMAAVFCAAGGVLAGLTIRNPAKAKSAETTPREFNCCLEGPPLRNLKAVPATLPADHEGQA